MPAWSVAEVLCNCNEVPTQKTTARPPVCQNQNYLHLLQILWLLAWYCRNQPLTDWTTKWPHENCALLGYYGARSGNFLPKFRDNLSVPSSRIKNPKRNSVRNCHFSRSNNSDERSSHLLRGGSLKSHVRDFRYDSVAQLIVSAASRISHE